MPIKKDANFNTFDKVGSKVFLIYGIFGIVTMLFAPSIDTENWWAIFPFCLFSFGLLGYVLFATIARDPSSLVSEVGIYLIVSYLVYFIFGPLLYVWGPSEGAEFSKAWYQINSSESVWLVGFNALGVSLSGLAYVLITFPSIAAISHGASKSWSKFSAINVFWGLVFIGFIAKYLFVVPYELGLTKSIPDSAMRQLGRLLIIAIILGNAFKANKKSIQFASNILTALEIFSGLLMFNKTEAILAIMAALLGQYINSKNINKLVIKATLLLALFVFIGPIVTFGRNELVARGRGVAVAADLAERLEITQQFFETNSDYRNEGQVAGSWWSRLNYLPPQQAALDLYKSGNGGQDIYLIPFIFVPRFIYPEKPEMTVAGVDLTEKVMGHRLSSTGIGIFVDGFYNLGWIGFILASISYGLALKIYAEITKPILKNNAFAMYPLVFMGIFVGSRIDGWWLTDVAGPLVFAVILLWIYRLTSK